MHKITIIKFKKALMAAIQVTGRNPIQEVVAYAGYMIAKFIGI